MGMTSPFSASLVLIGRYVNLFIEMKSGRDVSVNIYSHLD